MEYGWWSLLPPMLAIFLAILTRRVVLSLGAAILFGAGLLASGEGSGAEGSWVVRFLRSLWGDHLYPAFIDGGHQQVFWFSVTLGAMVGVIEAVGGMESLARAMMKRIRTRRGGQGLVWGLGLGIFFDDYANTLLLGSTMRSAADRLRFSRAKLAYLVDSTAAPVAGIALVSTWVATEISLIGDGLKAAGVNPEVTPFSIFLASVPTRIYPILALVMVALIAFTGRDFGPMLVEEQKAWRGLGGESSKGAGHQDDHRGNDDGNVPQCAEETGDGTGVAGNAKTAPWWTAVIPVGVCVLVIAWLLVRTGQAAVGQADVVGLRYWGEVIGNADSYAALVWGSLAGWSTSLFVSWYAQRTTSIGSLSTKLFWGSLRGAGHILPAMLILWLAWALSSMTQGVEMDGDTIVRGPFLDTGGFLKVQLQGSGLPGWLLPTAVFVTSGLIALATGTSWGTMALLTPMSVQLAISSAGSQAIESGGAYLVAVIGAVLAGSIFGDHCSPISDTTVLSSRASGCDHVLHVRTQLPYAFFVGGVSIVVGTIPGGWGVSPWISLGVGALILWGSLRFFGKDPET